MKIRVGKTKIMKSLAGNVSSCRHCSFYQSEGRRGGNCQQLGVPVQGNWSVCPLAVSPFKSVVQNLPNMTNWQELNLEVGINTVLRSLVLTSLESELTVASEKLHLESVSCQEP